MAVGKLKRKLTTIFCADVQGYSPMMANDEADTLQRLHHYRAIMADLFDHHDGRKVNTWGDAVIAEFSSVVEAVHCAVAIQDAIGAENDDLPEARQMRFRIGINLGDVMQDGHDLYGDGVNVAARMEGLADPGGIMVSETVYDLTHRQLGIAYDFAGEQTIKGRDVPVGGYRVRMPGKNSDQGTVVESRDPFEKQKPGGQATHTPSPPGSFIDRAADRASRFAEWYRVQPRAVRVPVGAIGLFAFINLITSGLSELWFVYPSIPFALMLAFGLIRKRR